MRRARARRAAEAKAELGGGVDAAGVVETVGKERHAVSPR